MRYMPLGEVAEVVSGATPRSGVAEYWDGDIPWVTPADLGRLDGPVIARTPRNLTQAGLRSCSARVLPAGSVLLSSRAPIGHVAINVEPMATNQGFKSLVPRCGVLDAHYLYHWLRAHREFLEGLGNGATFKELSKAAVERISLPVPDIATQRRTAAVLDLADRLRAQHADLLSSLEALKRSVFREMADDSDSSRTLGDVSVFVRGVTFKPDEKIEPGLGSVAVMRTKNVQRRLDRSDEIHIPASRVRRQDQYLRRGDIVISSANSWNLVGKACFVEDSSPPAVVGGFCTLLRSTEGVDAQWLFHWFTSARVQAIARSFSNQTTNIANLDLKRCRGLLVPVPPDSVQEEFASRVKSIDRQRDNVRRAMVGLDELIASLRAAGFRGEL